MKINVLAICATAAIASPAAFADEIRVLNWQGYGTDLDWAIAAFTEQTGDTVLHEYFASEQEMLTKLRTNPGAYDVVLVNSAYVGQAEEEGLIEPIDPDALANFADIDPAIAAREEIRADGDLFGVPWTWGVTSIAVDTGDFPTLPESLSILWDPAQKGKVSLRDDGVEAVGIAALATGQDINAITDMDAVRAKLVELLPQVRTFWGSENEWNQSFSAGDFDVATFWSGGAARSASKGLPVAFVIPKEGAIGWLDTLTVPASSTHKDAALAFIDWMIDPEFYVKWAAEGAPASANAKAIQALPEDDFNRKVLGDPAVVARVQFQQPIPDETREAYLKLWQDLKATQ